MRNEHQYTGEIGETDEGNTKLFEAESNSPNDNIRLSGDPEVLEAVKILLAGLPPTYDKDAAMELMERAVDEVYD